MNGEVEGIAQWEIAQKNRCLKDFLQYVTASHFQLMVQ